MQSKLRNSKNNNNKTDLRGGGGVKQLLENQ